MDFRGLQKEVYQNKVNHGFNLTDINMEFCLTYGELGEAYQAWLKKHDNVGEEIADVVIFLMGLSEILGIDLQKEIEDKIEKNKKRKYVKVNGILVKEGE
jgi:NTP pyrophosphatase (non-canonical NTP hydrolase)